MGISCPLQSAHPLGAKPKLNTLISDKNGSLISRFLPYRAQRLQSPLGQSLEETKAHAELFFRTLAEIHPVERYKNSARDKAASCCAVDCRRPAQRRPEP